MNGDKDAMIPRAAGDADWPDAARAGFPTRAFEGSSPSAAATSLLTFVARVTGRTWFWYTVAGSSRRRLYFGRLR